MFIISQWSSQPSSRANSVIVQLRFQLQDSYRKESMRGVGRLLEIDGLLLGYLPTKWGEAWRSCQGGGLARRAGCILSWICRGRKGRVGLGPENS